jgi:hypothetical protein
LKINGFPGQPSAPDVHMIPLYEPTLQFRWLVKGKKKTLQQYFYARNTGAAKWIDVPEVKDEPEQTGK